MCGIAGIWNLSESESIDSMVAAMHHRGPDDSGIYCDAHTAIGMARLAVIDTHPTGHQPMSTPDGKIWIVYNGEIYNYKSEREILESAGYSFRSTSDTEVVLRMYEQYGDDFLSRLRGIFALAIYDKRKGTGHERLLIARDHFGIKPLLYAKKGKTLIFASEIKALLSSGLIPPRINPDGLRLLLTFGSVYQPNTIIKDIHMLLPAHRMILENGKEDRIERYWSLGIDRISGLRTLPYEKQVAHLDSALKEVVRLQMISDVPLGAFLSGGVDSSILVAMMAQASDHKIRTFSIGFESEGADIDESDDAKKTASFIGTDHSHVLVTGSDVKNQILHIASGLDQPSVDGVNSYFVSRAARKGVTVAISGTGGDELFAGYPWFISMEQFRHSRESHMGKIRHRIRTIHRFSRNLIINSISGERDTTDTSCDKDEFLAHYASTYNIFGSTGASRLITGKSAENKSPKQNECTDLIHIDELSHASTIERVTGLCLRGYTCNQLLRDIDAVSMFQSLEVRVPYLDPVLVDFALSLPDGAKLGKQAHTGQKNKVTYRSSGAKRILIDVGRTLLPKDYDIQPKRGFSMPFDSWLRGPLNSTFEEAVSRDSVRQRGLLNTGEAEKIKNQFYAGKTGWAQPWLLMMTELWCREVLDAVPENFR